MFWWALFLAIFVCAPFVSRADAAPDFASEVRPLLDKYCFNCHGEKRPKGGVNLAKYADEAALQKNPKLLQHLVILIKEHEMPPANKPQPKPEEHEKLLAGLTAAYDNIDYSKIVKDPGRTIIHRLSRTEYNNTVRDLYGATNNPADKFPSDGGGGAGFDNNADTLFVPPILLEKYLQAAEEIVEQALPERVFISKPGLLKSRKSAAKEIIEHHGLRTFRRPLEKAETDLYTSLYSRFATTNHEAGVKAALKAQLVSPSFLFRIERDQETNGAYRINDWELASRLSYFIWGSMPDEHLFELARKGTLHKNIEQEVVRMLRDAKSRDFADSFAGQWLGIKSLKTTVQPDPRRYPNFTPELRDAMYDEPIQVFHSLLKKNGSLLDLLNADYTYVNEPLAKLYKIEGVKGAEMQRVALNDKNRGGLLGMASVLTLTSYPQRTSPVLRGKWILEEVLGTPTPPPPPNAGGLPADDAPKNGQTFRKRLELHRQKPECFSCHNRMDPLGFGLENFDGIGQWRTDIGGEKVDATGKMTSGEEFSGPAQLKVILLGRKDEFLRNVTEKMLGYALGRGLDFYDTPAVREIAKNVRESNYSAQQLVIEVAKSFPFNYRRNQPIEAVEK